MPAHYMNPTRRQIIAERAFSIARSALVETADMRRACAVLLREIARECPGVAIQPILWATALRNPPTKPEGETP